MLYAEIELTGAHDGEKIHLNINQIVSYHDPIDGITKRFPATKTTIRLNGLDNNSEFLIVEETPEEVCQLIREARSGITVQLVDMMIEIIRSLQNLPKMKHND